MTDDADRDLPHRAYAGLVSRLAALTLDIGLLCVMVVAVRAGPPFAWEQVLLRPAPRWLVTGAVVLAALLPWAYFTGSWWLSNQTVGDLVVGIAVLRPDGGEISLPHAALRAGAGLLLAPLWMIGLLPILWDQRRRAWHDMLFRTVVRYAPRPHDARPRRR